MIEREGLWVRRFPGASPSLVALHGFTQTGEMYGELAELLGGDLLAPDLPGHGRSALYPVSFASAVGGVAGVLAALGGGVPLVGYSQGGRVALAVAIEQPELVSRLILVSASAGIEDQVEREERRRADEARAAELLAEGVLVFLDRWLDQATFQGLERRGTTWRAADLARRLENTAAGLAAALVGMGQGAQPYFGDRLADLQMPVLVIAGGLDKKYASIAAGLCRALPYGTLGIIAGAGHAVIAEEAGAVAALIGGFLA